MKTEDHQGCRFWVVTRRPEKSRSANERAAGRNVNYDFMLVQRPEPVAVYPLSPDDGAYVPGQIIDVYA